MAQDISKMETTQTAVEWLMEQMLKPDMYKIWPSLLERAKAMEKEQMQKCASFWRGKENEIEKPMFDIYYNDTYGCKDLLHLQTTKTSCQKK